LSMMLLFLSRHEFHGLPFYVTFHPLYLVFRDFVMTF
jgi:hypothetical protein